MADLALAFSADIGAADLCIENGDFVVDPSLASTVLASLLTDARASGPELPAAETDPRGWWSDALIDRAWGGLIWTLVREKTTPEVQRRARDYAEAALSWMVMDGIARSVSVTAERIDGAGSGSILALEIIIIRPDGSREAFFFDRLWTALMERSS